MRKDLPAHLLAGARRAVFLELLGIVQSAHEREVGDLLDHLERIGDAARPEGVSHLIDFRAKFPCDHSRQCPP